LFIAKLRDRYALAPSQFEWPHLHTISVLSAIPSQWALQYFPLSGGMQLQAALAHFFGVLDMMPSFCGLRPRRPNDPKQSSMPQMWQRIAGEETWLNIFDYDSLNVLEVRDIPFEILPFL
jgi:hypothetical protein